MATSQGYDWNELANLVGDDTLNVLRVLNPLVASYPTATTTQSITVTGGVGSHTTTSAITGEISVISITSPSGADFTWYIDGYGGGTAYPIFEDTKHEGALGTKDCYRSPFLVDDRLTFGIKEATIDGTYKLHFIYRQGARVS